MSDIEELKSNPQALSVYQKYVRLKKEGKRWKGLCPFHHEKTPSFDVRQDDEVWIYGCFGCQAKGNVLQFVEAIEKTDFKSAVKIVRDAYGSWGKTKGTTAAAGMGESAFPEENKTSMTLAEFGSWEHELARNAPARNWLAVERGISYDTAKAQHLGCRVNPDGIWVAVPAIDGERVLAIEYRNIARKDFVKKFGMDTRTLFGLPEIDVLSPVFLTEGNYDRIVLFQAGFAACAVPGVNNPPSAKDRDRLMEAECVILAGDEDKAGRELMDRLWMDLQERTFRLHWPEGIKDANEFFLRGCGADVVKFRSEVNRLVGEAKSTPIPHMFNLVESMKNNQRTNLSDHPLRMRMPWDSVDKMAVLLPGSVMSVSATNTKMGKTQFCTQLSLHGARFNNEIVVNYQAELDIDEFSNIVASQVLKKSRNNIGAEDYQEAARQLQGIKYYIGRNPTFTTVEPVLELLESAIRRFGATMCILDHIHFLCRNTQNEVGTQENAMQALKNMGVKYGCKMIVVSQPRKAQATAKGKLIHVTDIKGSETLTSDADAIFAIHRKIMANKTEETMDDYSPETEIHLLGARSKGNGATFAKLMFLGDICTFKEMAHTKPCEEPAKAESIFG